MLCSASNLNYNKIPANHPSYGRYILSAVIASLAGGVQQHLSTRAMTKPFLPAALSMSWTKPPNNLHPRPGPKQVFKPGIKIQEAYGTPLIYPSLSNLPMFPQSANRWKLNKEFKIQIIWFNLVPIRTMSSALFNLGKALGKIIDSQCRNRPCYIGFRLFITTPRKMRRETTWIVNQPIDFCS